MSINPFVSVKVLIPQPCQHLGDEEGISDSDLITVRGVWFYAGRVYHMEHGIAFADAPETRQILSNEQGIGDSHQTIHPGIAAANGEGLDRVRRYISSGGRVGQIVN